LLTYQRVCHLRASHSHATSWRRYLPSIPCFAIGSNDLIQSMKHFDDLRGRSHPN
jgi:hypothetical protein